LFEGEPAGFLHLPDRALDLASLFNHYVHNGAVEQVIPI
jgi:hypothetical protein